jgi:hypothetical protein
LYSEACPVPTLFHAGLRYPRPLLLHPLRDPPSMATLGTRTAERFGHGLRFYPFRVASTRTVRLPRRRAALLLRRGWASRYLPASSHSPYRRANHRPRHQLQARYSAPLRVFVATPVGSTAFADASPCPWSCPAARRSRWGGRGWTCHGRQLPPVHGRQVAVGPPCRALPQLTLLPPPRAQ